MADIDNDNTIDEVVKKGGPSKKELKKLAKKAEKDAAKGKGAEITTTTTTKATVNTGDGGTAAAAFAVVAPIYQLANVPLPTTTTGATTIISDPCTLKACMASILYGIPLLPYYGGGGGGGGTTTEDSSLSFLHGPALLYSGSNGSSSGINGALAFGGNGIIKALALLSVNTNTNGDAEVEGEGTMRHLTPMMDDWLEYERCELRPALATNDVKLIERALKKIEAALLEHGGRSVVGGGGSGDSSLTAADVAITLTLLLHQEKTTTSLVLPSTIQAYVDTTKHSSMYASAKILAKSLLPPPKLDVSDPSLLKASSAIFASAILSVFPMAITLGLEIKAFKCKDIKHGDYQCNLAMPLYQKLKASGIPLPHGVDSPQKVAHLIIDEILAQDEESNPVLCDLSVNGPGFIMSRIKASYLSNGVNCIIQENAPTMPKTCGGGRSSNTTTTDTVDTTNNRNSNNIVVVDFSSPNIAKEMHVGHLRSTIIGEAVCRILEYTGSNVLRVNHVGDWGTQFGMLIQYLKEEYPDFAAASGGGNDANMPNITDLTLFYKNAKSRFDESPEFKKISQLNVVKLQAGDPECQRIWQVLCDISRREFEKVYNRLDITVEECGESFYNDKIPAVIDEFVDRGMISVEEGGAKCVFVPKFKVPLMLQKSDGGYGYDSTDMAAIKFRLHTLKASHLVYITDFTQGDHFQMVFAAAKKIGWVNDDSHRLDHIGFGTVQGEDGKRFKTRSGDTVRLVDLLDEAVSRMELSLKERIAEGRANISEEEVHETASAMGYGAVKYFDLRRNPTSNYIFSYDRMLDTKGNTAIYLLYAHARLESIITKGKADHGIDIDALIREGNAQIVLAHKSERNLGLHLQCFADSIEETLKDLYPYHICDFLYELSIAASEFVTQCKVLGSPEMESRLLLCRATAITMRQCFNLLGIRHVMRI